jgi:hypothetical protein
MTKSEFLIKNLKSEPIPLLLLHPLNLYIFESLGDRKAIRQRVK